MADPLFLARTNFYIGAYQAAISEASNLTGLNEEQKLEREVLIQRCYVEIGSYDVR
jgi:coatomer protein complex subunit epsilon